jgi:CRISPR-associated endonuclease Cas1
MAATQTVPEVLQSHKSLSPRLGVITLFGYGTSVRVERGHLVIEDGIADERRRERFARVGHGLKRLVVIGSHGFVSLAALRWMAIQKISFVMLERNGSVLVTTGPVRPSDARLRRAQALAMNTGSGLKLAIELIRQKLVGQEKVARDRLNNSAAGDEIARLRTILSSVREIESILTIEANAALTYWSAWSSLPIQFPRLELRRVPNHWRVFGARVSPLTHSPRLAVNPANALLNFLYAVLESESQLAIAELGLDPGLGVLHRDASNRDSFVFDVLEPVRPLVDAFVLHLLNSGPLRRQWFFEEANGNCRLMGPFVAQLAETALTWRKAVAPYAERAAEIFWQGRAKKSKFALPTRLTQNHHRQAKGGSPPKSKLPPRPPSVCHFCGAEIKFGRRYCPSCNLTVAREGMIEAAKLGRVKGHSPEARAKQAEKQRRHGAAVKSWNPSGKPNWLTEQFYREKIQPRLSGITVAAISSCLSISGPYAAEIRAGRYLPHPRHWQALAKLTGTDSGLLHASLGTH